VARRLLEFFFFGGGGGLVDGGTHGARHVRPSTPCMHPSIHPSIHPPESRAKTDLELGEEFIEEDELARIFHQEVGV
jgi:hypothetical protein